MSDGQLFAALTSLFLILAITVAAHLEWLRGDSVFGRIVIFIGALAAILLLGLQRVPPQWFDGSRTGFTLAASFVITGILPGPARSFRMPLMLGMMVPLLFFNIAAHL